MQKDLKIIFAENPSENDTDFITKGLNQETLTKRGLAPYEELALFIKDENDKLYGGLCARIYYGCLYIHGLYLEESIRDLGFGTKLVNQALEIGASENCPFAAVHTMEWEARGFYEKLGFGLKYTESGFLKNSKMHYLVKVLKPDAGYKLESF